MNHDRSLKQACKIGKQFKYYTLQFKPMIMKTLCIPSLNRRPIIQLMLVRPYWYTAMQLRYRCSLYLDFIKISTDLSNVDTGVTINVLS